MNDGKICVSVSATAADEMAVRIRSAGQFADVVEVRFDSLDPVELDVFISGIADLKFEKPILATFRSPEQGGSGSATRSERMEFWQANADKFWAIDLEEDVVGEVSGGNIRIVSHHDFSGVPADLDAIFDRLAATNSDVIKLAVTANDITDTIAIWKLIDRARDVGKKIIPIAMGDAGKWTRVLGLAHGAFLTYASLESGGETAPGQVNAREARDLYRVKQLDRETKVHGILGDPVSQSLSTFMHNPAFASVGFNGVFIPFLVKNIDEFMVRMVRPETREVELNFGGFSVTMPHKQSIMKHLDALDDSAREVGAVNTVKIYQDGIMGFNTDAHGFITPLKESYGELKGTRAAVFGAGGASRACIFAMQEEGVEVELFVRNKEKAKPLAGEFGVELHEIADFTAFYPRTFDILVDATPLGMSGPDENKSLLTADELQGVNFVYDLVTKPYDTPIVREAKKAGIPAIGGMEMLVAQGAKQFEIWTGKPAPVEQMKANVLARFAELNK